jgi:hypothetical protein
MTEALYVRRKGYLEPSALVASPWSQDMAHGGPSAALLVAAIEAVPPTDLDIARITVEMLSPIPMRPVATKTNVLRPGKRIQLVDAELTDSEGTPLVRAVAWKVRRREALEVGAMEPPDPPSPPEEYPAETRRVVDYPNFYSDAQERRSISGSIAEIGAAAGWFRLLVPLVDGEEPSPVQRLVTAADSANGHSRMAEFEDMLFINTDLTVHLARAPVGEWFALDSRSHYEPTGRGLSDTTLFDTEGFLGRSNQSLFLDEQPAT